MTLAAGSCKEDSGCCAQVGPKRRRLEGAEDILGPVRRAETSEATLAQRLTEYVERIDTDMVRCTRSMLQNCVLGPLLHAQPLPADVIKYRPIRLAAQALEYQMQQGMAEGTAQALYLVPRSALHSYGPRLAGGACTLRLLEVT